MKQLGPTHLWTSPLGLAAAPPSKSPDKASLSHAEAYLFPEGAADSARVAANDEFVVTVEKDLAAIEQIWRNFERRAVGSVFQSFDCISNWQGTIGSGEKVLPHIVLGRAVDGRVLFLLPFGITRRFGLSVLMWLGGRQADLKGGLFDEDFLHGLDEVQWTGIWRHIRARLPGFDVLHLCDQPARLGTARNPFVTKRRLVQPDQSHSTHLLQDWESFYKAKRSGSSRRVERARLRKLEAEGKVVFEIAHDRTTANALMERLFADKAKSLARLGVSDPFTDQAVREFYLRYAQHTYPRGQAHISALMLNGKPISIVWGLAFRGRFHYLLTTYDSAYRQMSPGRLHLNELIRWSLANGFDRFDFGVGEQDYKYDWCEDHVALFAAIVGRTLVGRAAAFVLRAKLRLKRKIKTSKILWSLAHAIRVQILNSQTRQSA